MDGPKTFQNRGGTVGGTEQTFIYTVYYYYSLNLTSKAAKVLGMKEDYEKYHKLAEETLNTIRDEYFSPKGRCAIQTQTALSLAIIHDLILHDKMKTLIGSLNKILSDKNYNICT